jgi:hypothetical protein
LSQTSLDLAINININEESPRFFNSSLSKYQNLSTMKSFGIATGMVAMFATAACAEMIGNRHPDGDPGCRTRILDPVDSGACMDISQSGSIWLYVESLCYAYESTDCSGEGQLVDGSASCHQVREWNSPGSLKCIGWGTDEM